MKIKVVETFGEPTGGFWAEVPALPGCYSQGENVDELMANIREAIAGVPEVLGEQAACYAGCLSEMAGVSDGSKIAITCLPRS